MLLEHSQTGHIEKILASRITCFGVFMKSDVDDTGIVEEHRMFVLEPLHEPLIYDVTEYVRKQKENKQEAARHRNRQTSDDRLRSKTCWKCWCWKHRYCRHG